MTPLWNRGSDAGRHGRPVCSYSCLNWRLRMLLWSWRHEAWEHATAYSTKGLSGATGLVRIAAAVPQTRQSLGRAEFELSEYRFFVYLGENVSCFVILFVLLYCQKSECDFEDEDSEVSHCIDYILFPLHKWSFVTWKGCDSKPYLVAEFVITLRSDKVGCGFRLFLL